MVVSGDSYAEDIKRMLREGANYYIVKSWGVGVIHHFLRKMLEQAA
jgi:DNA-binding NarL/FixJ family response regulator